MNGVGKVRQKRSKMSSSPALIALCPAEGFAGSNCDVDNQGHTFTFQSVNQCEEAVHSVAVHQLHQMKLQEACLLHHVRGSSHLQRRVTETLLKAPWISSQEAAFMKDLFTFVHTNI